jgi:hypothetical protein
MKWTENDHTLAPRYKGKESFVIPPVDIKTWSEYTWFDVYHEKYNYPKHVLHSVSGGADSAFCLWFHAHYVMERGLDVTFNVYSDYNSYKNGIYNTTPKVTGPKNFLRVVKYVRDMFPDMKFGEHRCEPNDFKKEGIADRREYKQAEFKKDRGVIPITITGGTMAPPLKIQEIFEMLDYPKVDHFNRDRLVPKTKAPFQMVAKDTLARLYKKYNIIDLFELTDSCIYQKMSYTHDRTKPEFSPCGDCWWCRERFWAFGKY